MPDNKYLLLICLTILLFLTVLPVFSAERAIKVTLRKTETQSAPESETIDLYKSSHALVIGINRYDNGWPILSGAVPDAEKVAAVLKQKGFSVILRKDLNSEQMKRAFSDFFIDQGADPQARLFVWFAGHGHTMQEEGFLIPADCPAPKNKRGFRRKALSLRRFGEYVRLADAKHAFAVFDSCFSGTIFTAQRNRPPAAVTRATAQPVRQFLSSGDADQTVSDNGNFRKLFIRAIRGEENADANQDGYITGSELGLFLTDRITNLTDAVQTPKYGKLRDMEYDRGDFVFVLNKTVPAPPAAPAPPGGGGASFDDLLKAADKKKQQKQQWAQWQSVRDQEFGKAKRIDGMSELSPAQKKEAWQRMITALGKENNPYSDSDDQMRQYAMGRIEHWGSQKEKPKMQSNTGKTWTEPATGMQFVWVPGGCFQMGDTFGGGGSDEKPVHKVCVDGFWMAKYEVTQGHWQKIMGSNPSYFKNGDNYPVEKVSWNDCQDFIRKLNQRSGKTFRLPYEAEWEYAARSGGKNEKYSGGSDVGRFAWYDSNSGGKTHPVGTKAPNGLGIYDMSGNVWEWCADWHGNDYYRNSPQNNPHGPSSGSSRLERGGSWYGYPWYVRAALRRGLNPGHRNENIGFRLLLSPGQVSPRPDDSRPSSSSNITDRDGVYVAYVNGTVRDSSTGLEWKVGPDKDMTWNDARSWVQSLGGDWRMPTSDELKTLYKKGKGTRNMTSLLKTTGWWVWSGETRGSSSAWYFNLYYGNRYWGLRSGRDNSRAFAVRSRGDG